MYKVRDIMEKPYLRHLLVYHAVILPEFRNIDSRLVDFGIKAIPNLEKNFKRLHQQKPYPEARNIYKFLPTSIIVKAMASNTDCLSFIDEIFLRNNMDDFNKLVLNGKNYYGYHATKVYDYWLDYIPELAKIIQIKFINEEIFIAQDLEFAEYIVKNNKMNAIPSTLHEQIDALALCIAMEKMQNT